MKQTILAIILSLCSAASWAQKMPYNDPTLPINERVADLLGRMTLAEKIGQLRCTLAWNYYELKGNKPVPSEQFKKDLREDTSECCGLLTGPILGRRKHLTTD